MNLSIMGMYEYDDSVFDNLVLPTYVDESDITYTIDREVLINNIMLQCAELEVLYPQIETMKLAIGVWSNANKIKWQKLLATEHFEYNPIWNVDADIKDTESITGSNNRSLTGTDQRDINKTGSGSDNETVNLTDSETVNLSDNRTINTADNETVNLTDTKSVQGFNSSAWAEAEKNEKTGTDNIAHTGTDNVTHTGTDSVTHTGTDNHTFTNTEKVDDDLTRSETETGSNTTARTYTQRRTGNIGVTATQDLIEKERQIADFSIIDYITDSFKNNFCLMIY